MWKFRSRTKRRTWIEVVSQHGAKGNIGTKEREDIAGWRKLHNQQLHNLYSLPNINRMSKWRRMRLAGHVARMGETRTAYKILVRNPERKRQLRRTNHRWLDNIRLDLRGNRVGRCRQGASGSGYEPAAGCFECSNEPSGSIKEGGYLD